MPFPSRRLGAEEVEEEEDEMEIANELKELKRRRSQLLEEIDVLERVAEEDRKRIKVGAPLPPGMLLVSDLPRPGDTEHFKNLVDMVESASHAHAIAASQVADAAATATRAASVAQQFAHAAAHAQAAIGPEAADAQAAASALAVETLRLTTCVASSAAAAMNATKIAASIQDGVVASRARAQSRARCRAGSIKTVSLEKVPSRLNASISA
ncbi:hypothetical protein CKAN_02677600 [Cinnamomum micranthum f. kanehirae]|uniref:Uncharacterized protein n=1 Tax=Cinnamomum micranthum f. kanehirae TaxID=337451 RepID=A0A3S3PAZ9_9MAGN|nr:hypothetical protein CKAN_02677600 [Cinnamomum micranthum f. kanehirae]